MGGEREDGELNNVFMNNKIVVSSVIVFFMIIGLLMVKSVYTVRKLGRQLITIPAIKDWYSNRNSPIDGFVNIGEGLYTILTSHHVPFNDLEVKSQLCDCLGHSLFVTNSIVIVSPKSRLCIRLRYDVALDKYHIVGYSGTIE